MKNLCGRFSKAQNYPARCYVVMENSAVNRNTSCVLQIAGDDCNIQEDVRVAQRATGQS